MAWRKPPGTAGQLTGTAVSPRRSGAKGYSRRVPRERKRKLWVNCSVWIFGKLLVYWVFSGKWKWVKKKLSKLKKKKKDEAALIPGGRGAGGFARKKTIDSIHIIMITWALTTGGNENWNAITPRWWWWSTCGMARERHTVNHRNRSKWSLKSEITK